MNIRPVLVVDMPGDSMPVFMDVVDGEIFSEDGVIGIRSDERVISAAPADRVLFATRSDIPVENLIHIVHRPTRRYATRVGRG